MRPCAALPVISATARNGARASAEVRIDTSAAAIGEQKAAVDAAVLGDPIGIGERKDRADRAITFSGT